MKSPGFPSRIEYVAVSRIAILVMFLSFGNGCASHVQTVKSNGPKPIPSETLIMITGPSTIATGTPCTIDFRILQPATLPRIDSAVIDWGDGTLATLDIETISSGQASATHLYPASAKEADICIVAGVGGHSCGSGSFHVTITGVNPPQAPTELHAVAVAGMGVRLDWRQPWNASSYIYERSSDAGKTWERIRCDRMADGTYDMSDDYRCQYIYRITAINDAGPSEKSAPSNPVRPIFGGVTLFVTAMSGQGRITWTYTGQDSASEFELEMCEPGVDNFYLIAEPHPDTGDVVISGLVPGHLYRFRMCADYESGGVSGYSAPVEIRMPGDSVD